MATQYGSWGSIHSNKGNYRVYITYSITETADSYTVTPTEIGVQAYSKTYEAIEFSGTWSVLINGVSVWSQNRSVPTIYTAMSGDIRGEYIAKLTGLSKTFSKTHSSQSATVKIQGSNCHIRTYTQIETTDIFDRSPNTTAYVTVNPKTSYTISFNTQGGSGSFGDLTKWHGEPLTIHSGKPTKANYTFVNWKIRNTSTTVDPGKQIAAGSNGNYILDAQWKIITYPVTFNANGGTGAPGNTTKNSGSALTFSSVKPTKKDASSGKEYDFLGWAETSAPNTIVYPVGNTTIAANVNRAVNLIAVWREHYYPPTIANTKIYRCNENSQASDEGRYAYVSFDWAIDNWKYPTNTASEVSITVGETTVTIPEAVDRLSGSVAIKIGSDPDVLFDVDTEYPVTISVADKQASTETLYKTTVTGRLNVAEYPLDFGSAVNSIGVFKPASDEAEYEKVIDIGGDVKIDGDLFIRGFELIDLFYPIGSYYETSDSTFDPNVVWGGTWALEESGRVHVSAGTGYSIGSKGGNKDAIVPYHNHGFTMPKMASSGSGTSGDGGSHSGTFDLRFWGTGRGVTGVSGVFTQKDQTAAANAFSAASNNPNKVQRVTLSVGNHKHSTPNHTHTWSTNGSVDYTGTNGNATNANMQPYIVVNRWHRTA